MQRENKNLLTGMFIGVAVGLAASYLLAPTSGGETRQKVTDAAEQASQRVKELVDKSREYVETKTSQLHEAVEAGKQAAEEKRHELEQEVAAQTGHATT